MHRIHRSMMVGNIRRTLCDLDKNHRTDDGRSRSPHIHHILRRNYALPVWFLLFLWRRYFPEHSWWRSSLRPAMSKKIKLVFNYMWNHYNFPYHCKTSHGFRGCVFFSLEEEEVSADLTEQTVFYIVTILETRSQILLRGILEFFSYKLIALSSRQPRSLRCSSRMSSVLN